MLSSSEWHLYTAGCAIDYGWSNLSTIQETLGRLAQCAEDDDVLTRDSMWIAFLDDWRRAKWLAWIHGWDGRCDQHAVFWFPMAEGFKYGFVIKSGNNGAVFVASPQPLPWLIESEFEYFDCVAEGDLSTPDCNEARFSDWYENHEIGRSTAYVLLRETGVTPSKKRVPGVSQWVSFLVGDQLRIMDDAANKFKRRARVADAVGDKSVSRVGPKLRMDILARDKYTCRICGAGRNEGAVLEVDHIHPASRGGTNDPENLQVLCRDCNVGKSDRIDL